VSAAGVAVGPVAQRRRLRVSGGNVALVIVIGFLALLALCAIAPGLIAPHDPLEQNLIDRLKPPFSQSSSTGGGSYILGTDTLGRDVLSRLIYSARLSIGIGITCVIASSLIGMPLGVVAGYKGGAVDSIIMRFVDGVLSFPLLILAIYFLFVVGPGLFGIILVLTLMRWVSYTRVARSLALSYRNAAFVEAAQSVGCSSARVMLRHILPNILSPLLVLATLEMALVMLADASLSFLGLGVQPPTPTWGVMVAEGRDFLATAWWLIVFPGLAILLATVSLNVLAMQLRDRSDKAGRMRFIGFRTQRQR
jgi:peptide/nickel transport system permease protein